MDTDDTATVKILKQKVSSFCDERDWKKYHNAKDLAIGIITESSELLEHFRFKSEEEIDYLFSDPLSREAIEDEFADVLFFMLRLSENYNIDATTALLNKIKKNAQKYPVEKVKGLNKKYTEYTDQS